MPMPMPPSGGLPSPLTQAPANAGSMTQQQGNQGNIQAALVKVKGAMKMLEEALPLVPMGNEVHSDILDALKKFTKHVKSDVSAQQESGSLQSAAQNVVKQAPQSNMARMFAANQGAGQPPAMEGQAA